MNSENITKLGKRIPLIGREQELVHLEAFLRAPGSERHFVYYWAYGGLGKTRLLEELQRIVKKAGPRFYFSGIIDLYHTDTHTTSDLERIIVEGLDPQQQYFVDYRQERKIYTLLRERGTDPGILEERRKKLGDLFVEGCKEMALKASKLVICFDTIELLQYESSVVEEKAGLDTADTRVKPWLLDKLAQLSNVLVVFAGRPKQRSREDEIDPQTRLLADMTKAFGEDLTVVELQPFTFEETKAFLKFFKDAAEDERELIPSKYVKVVYRLTGGRPIFLHLMVDWLTVLALELGTILRLFDRHMDLTEVPENDERLKTARQEVERGILNAVFNNSGEIGGYLTNIALMPRGVDASILNVTLGLPLEEATQLLKRLEPLSFIKSHKSLPGITSLRGEYVFLHDELYRLLTSSDVIPYLRMNERRVANTLVQNYYDPQISELEEELAKSGTEERLPFREQLQRLQVERVFYLLVINPREGYKEYKRLADQANRHRWVGFAMRLLDEFLRFYNTLVPDRRTLFEEVGILHDQIIRESAWMWVERFDWWGQDDRVIQLAEYILNDPATFAICSDGTSTCSEQDMAIMGNIYAFWTGARARRHSYEPEVVEKALAMLALMPSLINCSSEQALARARLATALGFQFRLGGLLDQAVSHYVDGNAAFRKLENLEAYSEEYTLLLQSLAIVYAEQGRMAPARSLAHEALRINEEIGSEFSTGLTLITLSGIARMRGNHQQALDYAEEALALFRAHGDARGLSLAHLASVQARRWKAKHELEKRRKSKLENVQQMFEEARVELENALPEAERENIGSVIPQLYAELGRIYRDSAQYSFEIEDRERGFQYYRLAEIHLCTALEREGWNIVERADILHDLAEVLFALGEKKEADVCLEKIVAMIGEDYLIVPGQHVPEIGLHNEYFAPLGKVELMKEREAFKQKLWVEGVQHDVMAFAYFVHFSPEAVESENMLEPLYNQIQDVSVDDQREILAEVRDWADHTDFGVKVSGFMEDIARLFGV